MKIYYRPINFGETFCTSVKNAKDVFKNTEVKLCFGEFKREYRPYKNEIGYGYYKKNIHGKVIASMILEPSVICPLLKFYVLKSDDISNSIKSDFENNVLLQLRDIYAQFCSAGSSQQKTTVFWVELLDNKFYIHKFVS